MISAAQCEWVHMNVDLDLASPAGDQTRQTERTYDFDIPCIVLEPMRYVQKYSKITMANRPETGCQEAALSIYYAETQYCLSRNFTEWGIYNIQGEFDYPFGLEGTAQ